TPELQARIPASVLRVAVPGETLADVLPVLAETYCGTIAYEIEHLSDHQQRVWLRQAIESGAYRQPFPEEQRRALFRRLCEVEGMERFLRKRFLGQKQFSLEGLDVMIPMLDETSHLEAVDPVVEGRTRAEQTDRSTPNGAHDPSLALAVLLHGDAAFAGQGIVAETFNLHDLEGYSTGGTLHLITNNQIGFTSDPDEGRSTRYSSDLAKGFDVPIIHVNADDPEAAISAVRLAMAYRR